MADSPPEIMAAGRPGRPIKGNAVKTIRSRLTLCASVLTLAVASAVSAQPTPVPAAPGAAPAAARPPGVPPAAVTVKLLKPGVYMLVGGGGNSTLDVTKAGAILVDTKNMGEPQYKNLLDAIKSVTPQPVKYVVDTHHHADHTGNNEFFERDGAKVLGQENMVQVFKTYTSTLAPHTPAIPNVTFKRTQTVLVGGVKAEVFHYGGGHTGNDAVIYFPASKVVAAGDLLDSRVPNYDAPFGGKLLGYQQSLADILKLDFDLAVPGHGDAALTKDEVRAYKAKIDKLVAQAQAVIQAGTPEEQFIDTINPKIEDLGWKLAGQFWAPKPRLDALYAELKK